MKTQQPPVQLMSSLNSSNNAGAQDPRNAPITLLQPTNEFVNHQQNSSIYTNTLAAPSGKSGSRYNSQDFASPLITSQSTMVQEAKFQQVQNPMRVQPVMAFYQAPVAQGVDNSLNQRMMSSQASQMVGPAFHSAYAQATYPS